MSIQYCEERKKLAKTMKLLWDRKLTNAAGGNAAMRVAENRIIITPSMMSEHRHCEIDAEDILLCDYDLNIIEGTGVLSRESRMHAMLLKNIPEIGAVIHAHPEYTMVYVAAMKPIPSVTEATQKMGDCMLIAQARRIRRTWRKMCMTFSRISANCSKKPGFAVSCRCMAQLPSANT